MLRLTVAKPAAGTGILRSAPQLFLAAALAWPALAWGAGTNVYALGRSASPTHNPLKGFMPYAGHYATFPHSMEWSYFSLRTLMTGPTNFDWSGLETALDTVASRGHQTVFRVYLDYPGHSTGLPQYLLDAGVATHRYTDYENSGRSVSPDYEHPLLRQALTNFVAALGERYDGDPRIGFITVGLLGFWGEWHTYPHSEWFASTAVQDEVLTAYGLAFTKTRLLVRRPAGTNPSARPLGYHDDSFAYQTVDPPNWMFLGLLKAAGETNKWRTQPIGGEVRPEVQRCLWDITLTNCVPPGQDFARCVELTHASWMLNHGAFSPGLPDDARALALAGSTRLGYELQVSRAELVDASASGSLRVGLSVQNAGVAPFYYDWPVQLSALDAGHTVIKTWTTDWRLSAVLPSATQTHWTWSQPGHGLEPGQYTLLLRVANPLANGLAFRFANDTQDADLPGWLTLGRFAVVPNPAQPALRGSLSPSGIDLNVSNAAPGTWTVERTADWQTWSPLLSTNTSTADWIVADEASALARFYRVVGSP